MRLHIIAEGRTEEKFINKVLAKELVSFNVFADVRCVETSRDKNKIFRGGLLNYAKAKSDILEWIKQEKDPECRFTTMFDLYALPNDFPEYDIAKEMPPYQRVEKLENALAADINSIRFIPYIQLHEFEALLFSDIEELKIDSESPEHDKAIQNLKAIALKQPNPELINDSPETAPSKRILKEIPEYEKVTAGVNVAEKIGLPRIREKCQHFNEWLNKLENLK
jgi:hypothetical protein